MNQAAVPGGVLQRDSSTCSKRTTVHREQAFRQAPENARAHGRADSVQALYRAGGNIVEGRMVFRAQYFLIVLLKSLEATSV